MTRFEGHMIFLTRTQVWPTLIQKLEWPFKLSWALDAEDLISEASARPGSLALVEFAPDNLAKRVSELAKIINNPYHLGLVATGDSTMIEVRSLFLSLGCLDFLWTI